MDINGWTMLHAASFHGRLGCVQVLLRWDLRIEDTDKAGNNAGKFSLCNPDKSNKNPSF